MKKRKPESETLLCELDGRIFNGPFAATAFVTHVRKRHYANRANGGQLASKALVEARRKRDLKVAETTLIKQQVNGGVIEPDKLDRMVQVQNFVGLTPVEHLDAAIKTTETKIAELRTALAEKEELEKQLQDETRGLQVYMEAREKLHNHTPGGDVEQPKQEGEGVPMLPNRQDASIFRRGRAGAGV